MTAVPFEARAPIFPAWRLPIGKVGSDLLIVLSWALGLRIIFAVLTANTYDPDEFVILVLSRDWTHGAVPYRDFMFFHPPGMLVLFRLLAPLTSWWWPSARVVVLLIDTATALCVWRIGTILYGRRTALAAGLLYGASPLALVCAVRVEQDPIITALGIGGLTVLLSTRTYRGAALAGACLGLAVCVKYPAAIFLPVYILAAPRRAIASVPAAAATAAVGLAPFIPEFHSLYDQTVTWQLVRRTPLDLVHRFGGVAVFWLLLNPLAVFAVIRGRKPVWLVGGFALGGVFVFASQAYYHYFVPILPFAALLAAPIAADLIHRWPRKLAVGTIAFVVAWAVDVDAGTGPTSLFITASHLSAVQATARVIDRWTSPRARVLTDQFEYAFLASRTPATDYFWNMSGIVHARDLETRLPTEGAVVMTDRVAATYPSGFTEYLTDKRFLRIQTGTTQIWLLIPNRLAAETAPGARVLCNPVPSVRRVALLTSPEYCP
ncbi:MAG TPA: glycosyltransferase family 39 protein [Chloroflexota bacterium]